MMEFQAPFPWFGGKSTITRALWQRLGNPSNYVEPFFGSGAALLKRPGWQPDVTWTETVNDADGFIANFWRAVQHDPDEVAYFADWPVNENDLHARHMWLRERRIDLTRRLEGDPDYYDAKIAGWWVWGLCCWIGSGWCDPNTTGPWQIVTDAQGLRQLVHVGNAGRGVKRQLVHVGDAGRGVKRQLVHVGDAGQGVKRQRVHVGDAGRGRAGRGRAGTGESGLILWMQALAERLARVRVCSGDWSRVMGESVTVKNGLTAVFLDPPYSLETGRKIGLYSVEDGSVAHAVREWCVANGENPLLRVALCGYDTEHGGLLAHGWTPYTWKANGGYAHQGNGNGQGNSKRETIWFSPHCLKPVTHMQLSLFGEAE